MTRYQDSSLDNGRQAIYPTSLQWRHNGSDGLSNHQPHDSSVYSGADQRKYQAPRHWPSYGEHTGDRCIPRTKAQLRGKCFHLMTSSYRNALVLYVDPVSHQYYLLPRLYSWQFQHLYNYIIPDCIVLSNATRCIFHHSLRHQLWCSRFIIHWYDCICQFMKYVFYSSLLNTK